MHARDNQGEMARGAVGSWDWGMRVAANPGVEAVAGRGARAHLGDQSPEA